MPEVCSYAITAAVIAGAMIALWLLSLKLRDSSIVDIFWGAGFVLIAWITAFTSGGAPARCRLVLGLTTVWGLRLAGYLAMRNRGRGEDPRYAAMRAAHERVLPVAAAALRQPPRPVPEKRPRQGRPPEPRAASSGQVRPLENRP